MIAVDTNVIAYLLIQGERTSDAVEALRKDSQWVAPVLWRSELRDVLASYLRRKELDLGRAQVLMGIAEEIMSQGEYQVMSEDVLQLASVSGCSAYDCEFVALAADLGLKLVTNDRVLLACFPQVAVPLQEYVQNPSGG